MLEPVTRRSLTDAVFERLCGGILDGHLAPGEALPAERALAVQLGVNRNALREALKRLEQLRLIAIHPGESTRVLDFRHTSGLDLLVALLFSGGGALKLEAARSLIELRTALGPDIAERAAERGGVADFDRLDRAHAALAAVPVSDPVTRQRRSMALWRVLVAASGNLAYQLAFNTMEQGWASIQDLVAPALADELGDARGYDLLCRAVRRGDGARARGAAERLVGRGEAGLLRAVGLADGPARARKESP